MRFIAKKCTLENKITDGEPAMIAVCLKSFSKCSLRRCTRYLEANYKHFLMGMNMKENIKDAMLDVVFGEHVFVGAENKLDLKKKKERYYYIAFRNGKTVLTTGRALKQ